LAKTAPLAKGDEVTMTINDIGPKPQSFDIRNATKENLDYRAVAWSGRYLQVTLMSIPIGVSIGLEALRLPRFGGRFSGFGAMSL
jgi:hypothetical protein